MAIINLLNIRGAIDTAEYRLKGKLANNNSSMRGSTTVPTVLDRTAIHYNTSAGWADEPTTVGVKGNLYIYSDYKVIRNEDETVTVIPAFKIGDGTTLLKDLPFNTEDGTAMYDEETETLTFIF